MLDLLNNKLIYNIVFNFIEMLHFFVSSIILTKKVF